MSRSTPHTKKAGWKAASSISEWRFSQYSEVNDILLLSADVLFLFLISLKALATPDALFVLPSSLVSLNRSTYHRSLSLQLPWISSLMIEALAEPITSSSQRGY